MKECSPVVGYNRHGLLRNLANGLFVAHTFLLILLTLPYRIEQLEPLYRATRRYATFVGLNQQWNLFAPYPRTFNARCVIKTTFASGKSEIWQPSVIRIDGIISRYRAARYCKFLIDRLPLKKNSVLLGDVARYVLKNTRAAPDDAPREIVIVEYRKAIELPGQTEDSWHARRLFLRHIE